MSKTEEPETAESLRLDKWLVHARFCKTRAIATTLITKKRVRINRDVVSKASRLVRVCDVLTRVSCGAAGGRRRPGVATVRV